MNSPLPDGQERERATTTFDRNVVVTAGAGTGKTTLLVDRLVNLLMREPSPLEITEIVALTFTNKAANEMKIRLRSRLEGYLFATQEPTSGGNPAGEEELDTLRHRYVLSREAIETRARAALRYLERAEIGTIHSFAASLLRLYPLEADLDPQFQEDDGSHFQKHFEESWGGWLNEELSGRGPRTHDWKDALARFPLEQLRELAFALCSETVDLDALQGNLGGALPEAIRSWLLELEKETVHLIRCYPQNRKVEKLVKASRRMIQSWLVGGGKAVATEAEGRSILSAADPARPQDWDPQNFAAAKRLVRIARALGGVDHAQAGRVCSLLIPFAKSCRESFIGSGFVSFDGLLVRARNLVRDFPRIREELKRRFKAVLVDEFQDTDPLQCEILLYLCETPGRCAKEWRNVRLAAGKVFVVGDPKQSIYAFRGADIEAYLKVVEIITAQNGIECRLTTNFRSHETILNVVNAVFQQLIRPRDRLQPPYIAIHPPKPAERDAARQRVLVRRVDSTREDVRADLARRVEAESLARWLGEEVLYRPLRLDHEGNAMVVQPGHIACLMRSLTHVHTYLEALRRYGIRYVVEGERNFYATREVIEAVNLLRVIDNPYDRLALAGVLRSALAGLSDVELYELHQKGLLDYRMATNGRRKKHLPPPVRELYLLLLRLHEDTPRLPAGEAVAQIFKVLPMYVLAATTFHGEQAVANLEKIHQVAEEMGEKGAATLREVIAELERRVKEVREEPESALDEETLDAIRVLSIHKAKGLEFPIVVLLDSLSSVDQRGAAQVTVRHDWPSGLTGLRLGDLWSLPGVFLEEKRRSREEQEQRRVLYVASTRPREQLVISFASRSRESGQSFLSLLEQATGDLSARKSATLACGSGAIALDVFREDLASGGHTGTGDRVDAALRCDWPSYRALWRRRKRRYDELMETGLFLTPTWLKTVEEPRVIKSFGIGTASLDRETALTVGEVAHKILERWDYQTEDGEKMLEELLGLELASVPPGEREVIEQEIRPMLLRFLRSPAYQELQNARILGREVSLLMPWGEQVAEGVIDLIYESNGRLFVADYKTDQVSPDGVTRALLGSYQHQASIYSEAARRGLNREVEAFKLILVRLGQCIRV